MKKRCLALGLLAVLLIVFLAAKHAKQDPTSDFLGSAEANSQEMVRQGKQIFRFDTFGDTFGTSLGLFVLAFISHRSPTFCTRSLLFLTFLPLSTHTRTNRALN
jgi:hypothetical protein